MDKNISIAKDELFDSLQNFREVQGASVRGRNGDKYIVILLSQLTDRIKKRLNSDYHGNKVTYEIIGKVKTLGK